MPTIEEILAALNIDFTDPDARAGALEAIEAIQNSRAAGALSGFDLGELGGGGGQDEEAEVEIDPDLIQPSDKSNSSAPSEDVEIEDDEDLLSQIKVNTSEDSSSDMNQENSGSSAEGSDTESSDSNKQEPNTNGDTEDQKAIKGTESTEDTETTEEAEEGQEADGGSEDKADEKDSGASDSEGSGENSDEYDSEETEPSEFDEEDIVDDELKDTFTDKTLKDKSTARRIKRERTLAAGKNALDKAIKDNAPKGVINQLQKAIDSLEALKEGKEKTIDELSDEEFDLLINRVLDAIDDAGDTSLTVTSQKERELRAQEIKADLASQETQDELSAEDIAQIRAETRATKARAKEPNKYKKIGGAGAFKGFNEFLTSLYRAIALQVQTEEAPDDSWGALNRRYAGTSILRPGSKLDELPEKKIPVIDFYFDCSGSWTDTDLEVGKRAVAAIAELEKRGQIKINIYYFANNVHDNPADARREGGTSAWNEIVKNVIATQATNVIIMTDGDMESWYVGSPLSYTVPGYVWYLWKNGDSAPRLPKDLNGRAGTQQFAFSD